MHYFFYTLLWSNETSLVLTLTFMRALILHQMRLKLGIQSIICTSRSALSNPVANRHMWRQAQFPKCYTKGILKNWHHFRVFPICNCKIVYFKCSFGIKIKFLQCGDSCNIVGHRCSRWKQLESLICLQCREVDWKTYLKN